MFVKKKQKERERERKGVKETEREGNKKLGIRVSLFHTFSSKSKMRRGKRE